MADPAEAPAGAPEAALAAAPAEDDDLDAAPIPFWDGEGELRSPGGVSERETRYLSG